MSKSILAIDTPESRAKCPCFLEVATDCCGVNGKDIESNSKPDWCPLRDFPEKKPYKAMGEWLEFNCGFNACIDEILKGGEAE